jgi:hypothetical protein
MIPSYNAISFLLAGSYSLALHPGRARTLQNHVETYKTIANRLDNLKFTGDLCYVKLWLLRCSHIVIYSQGEADGCSFRLTIAVRTCCEWCAKGRWRHVQFMHVSSSSESPPPPTLKTRLMDRSFRPNHCSARRSATSLGCPSMQLSKACRTWCTCPRSNNSDLEQ